MVEQRRIVLHPFLVMVTPPGSLSSSSDSLGGGAGRLAFRFAGGGGVEGSSSSDSSCGGVGGLFFLFVSTGSIGVGFGLFPAPGGLPRPLFAGIASSDVSGAVLGFSGASSGTGVDGKQNNFRGHGFYYYTVYFLIGRW